MVKNIPTLHDVNLLLQCIDVAVLHEQDLSKKFRLEELRRKIEQPVSALSLESTGGEHLAVMRNWIQTAFIGGDTCTWGSTQPIGGCKIVQSPMMYEQLACRIAAAGIGEYGLRVKGVL